MDIDPNAFIPVKVLINLRRDALMKLDEVRINTHQRASGKRAAITTPAADLNHPDKPSVAVTISSLERLH